jgi:hypothetical protein
VGLDPAVSVGVRVGVWVVVGCTKVEEDGDVGEAKGVCCTDGVDAARVKATLVATVPVSVPVPPACGMLQAVRRMISNIETARRGKINIIFPPQEGQMREMRSGIMHSNSRVLCIL